MFTSRQFSLRFSLGSAFAGIVVLTVLCLGFATFYHVRAFIRQDMRVRIHDLVGTAASQIDSEMHEAIRNRDDENGPHYAAIKKQLRGVLDHSTGVRFVYTMRKAPAGTLVFVVDAEDKTEAMSHVGDPYTPTPLMLAAFDKPGEVKVEESFSSDRWGSWLSGYAPIQAPDGSIVGIVGIDISTQKVVANERRYLVVILVSSLLVTALVVLLGIVFSRSISKPLLLLAGDLENVRRFELDTDIELDSRVTEVEGMKTAIDNTKCGLRSFKKYVPADLVAELIQLGKEAALGAEKKELTVFFSDIADFTTICENLGAEELAESLRLYFEGMTRAVIANQGTVDKYIGDAVMAFWGAPSPVGNHAELACRAALECQERLLETNRERRAGGRPVLQTRIGLNTGEVIVGNFGYEERLNYTVMGDNVNLASRLEGLNKYYGTRIIISESTRAQVSGSFETRRLDFVVAKGKTQGITIYELVAERGKLSEAEKESLDLFNRGGDLYFNRQWSEAAAIFAETLRRQPDDRPSQIMLGRCREFLQNPPPADWSGTVVMREK